MEMRIEDGKRITALGVEQAAFLALFWNPSPITSLTPLQRTTEERR
jgi:hypothetical protein